MMHVVRPGVRPLWRAAARSLVVAIIVLKLVAASSDATESAVDPDEEAPLPLLTHPTQIDYWRMPELDAHVHGNLVLSRHWLESEASAADKRRLVAAFLKQHEAELLDRESHREGQQLASRLHTAVGALAAHRTAQLLHVGGFWLDALRALPSHDLYITPLVVQQALLARAPASDAAVLDDEALLRDHLVGVTCRRVAAAPQSRLPVCDESAITSSARGSSAACDDDAAEPTDPDGAFFKLSFRFNRSHAGSVFPFRALRLMKYFLAARTHNLAMDAVDVDGRSHSAADAIGSGSAIDWSADVAASARLRGKAALLGSFFSLFPTEPYFASLSAAQQQQLKLRVAALVSDVCMFLSADPIAFRDRWHEEQAASEYLDHHAHGGGVYPGDDFSSDEEL